MTDVSTKGSSGQPWWKQVRQGLGEDFRWYDGLILLLGSVLGLAGNALFNGDESTVTALLILGFITLCAAISISRFRIEIQTKSIATLEDTHKELDEKLKKHLNQVHASVSFVPDTSATKGAPTSRKRSYDSGTAAVRGARDRIFVVGDYCPPPGEDATLDQPPEHRFEYLQTIEDMLTQRLKVDSKSAGTLQYRRFIQRPRNVYNQIKERVNAGNPGVVLKPEDMIGDEQVFEHCRRVLNIAGSAEKQRSDHLQVEIKVIPFLPNCPSILLVDNRDVLLAIPTRIDRPGDKFARQGMLGSLVMEDKARGSEICTPFEKLFDTLTQFSVTVIKVENKNPDASVTWS